MNRQNKKIKIIKLIKIAMIIKMKKNDKEMKFEKKIFSFFNFSLNYLLFNTILYLIFNYFFSCLIFFMQCYN